MPGLLDETASAAPSGMASDLIAGIQQLSADQQFTFTRYTRLVLPADGFVFFAPASAVSQDTDIPFCFSTNGSLHVTQTFQQEPEANYARQDITFTTKAQALEFSQVAPDSLWVLTIPNGSLVAFSGQRGRFDQAGIWHYSGKALLPFEQTQFIESAADVLPDSRVVSNSLPIWMAMSTDDLPVYPSFLVPRNAIPPYVAVDIKGTEGIAVAPYLGPDDSQTQLATEVARFTFYGLRNDQALDFQKLLLDNSFIGVYGVMNIPVPVDGKRAQSDFGIIAQEKAMDLQINYHQARARDIARKLISSAFITITPA